MHTRSGQSSYRDRTQEFLSVSERLKKSSSAPNPQSSDTGSKVEGSKLAVSIQSEFNKKASRIGLGIHQTSQKLLSLAELAKSKVIFEDRTREIQELTSVIKEDITVLNSQVVDLQLLCNSQTRNGNISTDTNNYSTTVVDTLKNRLMVATKEFKGILTKRTENLKAHESRQQLFSSSTSMDVTNPFVRQRPLASRTTSDFVAPPAPWDNNSSSSSQFFSRKKSNGDPSSASQSLLHHQQQQMVPLQDGYMHSRVEALQNVESTIHELSSIFTQLATMVSQQGELAIRIDENMDDTLANVEGAQGQLLKYLNSISSNRWLMLKVFSVLIVFLMIFVFFVA